MYIKMNYFYSTIRVESECPHSLEFDFQNKLTQPYSSKTALTGTDASLTTLTPLQTKNSFWQLKTDLVSGNADFVGAATQTVTLTASCP
jgi:hypothetical protein